MKPPLTANLPAATVRNEHLPFLDALRGFAILGVVLTHCLKDSGSPYWPAYGISGERGVQLFYIISAFSLYQSYEVRRTRERHPLSNYFIRRFFRIAPLFYLASLGAFCIYGLGPRPESPEGVTILEIVGGMLFLNGLHPHTINGVAMGGWSVAVENSFYLVLPLFFTFITTLRRSLMFLVVSLVLAPLVSTVLFSWVRSRDWNGHLLSSFFQSEEWGGYFFHYWFLIELPVFVMGICAYYLCKKYRVKKIPSKVASLLLITGAVFFFWENMPVFSYQIYLSSSAFIPLVLGLYLYEWPLLVNRVTVFMGKISYSLYLTHFFFLLAVGHAFASHFWIWGLYPPGTPSGLALFTLSVFLPAVLASTITFLVIEKTGIWLGKQLIQSREKMPVLGRL